MKTEVYELNGKQIRIPIAECYKDCMTLIKSDRYKLSGKKESTLSIVLQSLKPYKSSVLFWLRLCQHKGWLYPFCKIMCARAKRKTLVALPTRTKIGYGFSIGAQGGMCIAINGGTIIGNNVNISQFVNIGTNSNTYAIIGDNVYIGPHTCVVEDVKICNNATIGAGAVVTRDIPENATAAGVPAKVLNYDNPGRYIKNPWPISE
jgi:serine O-acetyltransferase